MTTIYFRGTRAQARAAVLALPSVLAGRNLDPGGECRKLQMLAGMVALSLVKDAYVTKSRGGTDAAGERWAPLAASTIRGRRQGKRKGGRVEILRDTDITMNSLSPGVNPPGQILTAKAGETIVGTNVPYAHWHHEGTRKMPQRKLWPDPDRWPGAWWDLIAKKVLEGAGRVLAKLLGV